MFTTPSQGHVCIDGKEFHFKVIRETNKECYSLESQQSSSNETLRWIGIVDSKLILQSAISDLHEFVPEASSPVRRSKRLSSAGRQMTEVAPLIQREASAYHELSETLPLPTAAGTIKSLKRPRLEASSSVVGEGEEGRKVSRPTHQLKWLVLRAVPPHTSRTDIASLMEGIRLKALYICPAEIPSHFDVYVEFESVEGAELGLMRSGEPVAGAASKWAVEAIQRPEAVWAKAVGVRLAGRTKVSAAYEACMGQLLEELRGMRPGPLRQRLQSVCKNALSPEQVSDTYLGLGNKLFSPIEAILFARPSPFTSSSLAMPLGRSEDDSTTAYLAGQLDRLIVVWSTAHLSQNALVLELCSRMLSAFQLAYELSWRRHCTQT